MRHNDRSAAPFDDIEDSSNGLIYSKRVFDDSFLDHIMVNAQKDYFIFYIGILQKRKFGIKLCFHGNFPFLVSYIDSKVFFQNYKIKTIYETREYR